jgi:hypothetical protein
MSRAHNPPTQALQAAREQVSHAIDHLDGVRADLEATVAALRLPEDEEEIDLPLAGEDELAAVIRCSVHDHLKPLIASLRSLIRLEPEEEP